MAEVSGDDGWKTLGQCKILTLEHHMAAKRMGFQHIFDPLYAVEGYRTGLLEGTFPATYFFTRDVLPLVTAHKRNDKFAIAKIARERSPLLSPKQLKASEDPRRQLQITRDAVESLMSLWAKGHPTCGAVLENIAKSELFAIPDSLKPLLDIRRMAGPKTDAATEQADPLPEDTAALDEFLEASFAEVLPYASYVSDVAPFGTHQGVKGLEFDRVMVLMDDSESRGFLFAYEKLFGAKELSVTDRRNVSEGRETTLDRTRRLFYVTCSRARRSLALVAYSANPDAVRTHVVGNGWFDAGEVVLQP